jgi:hypothetical protein
MNSFNLLRKCLLVCLLALLAAPLQAQLPLEHQVYGATLGHTWGDFPVYLTPDLETTAGYEKLDVSLPIYLVYQNIDNGGVTAVPNGPKRVDDVFDAEELQGFQVTITYDLAFDVEYIPCPNDVGLDLPEEDSYPIDSTDGTLQVQDLNFGGIGSGTWITLTRDYPVTGGFGRTVIVISWARPHRVTTDVCTGQTHDAEPSHVVCTTRQVSGLESGFVPITVPRKVVLWVSTDIAGNGSPRYVDAADLSAFGDHYPSASIDWGFSSESTRNYHCNLNLTGAIDSSDLTALGQDLGVDQCGGTPKAQVEGEREAILEWFGIEPTGEMVPLRPGQLAPELEVVDWVKFRAAARDPYGYRRTPKPPASLRAWTGVKGLYR